MTCHTDSPEAEKAYLHFVEHVDPKLKPRQFKLAQTYLAHPLRSKLPKDRYFVFDRNTQLLVELFRDENVPLETEESKLGQRYQKLMGSLTVNFRGEEKTLIQMGRYLEETDRSSAPGSMGTRRQPPPAKWPMNAIKSSRKCCVLRQQIARNAGFKNYLDYAFRAKGRFDYAPKDCVAFHDAIDTQIMPVLRNCRPSVVNN